MRLPISSSDKFLQNLISGKVFYLKQVIFPIFYDAVKEKITVLENSTLPHRKSFETENSSEN